MIPPPRALLFDWDNTLVDGWPAILAGLNAAFAAFGLPPWDHGRMLREVRRSLRESFPAIFGAEWERARDIFTAEVRAVHLSVLRPLEGAEVLLEAAARWPLAVVSNKQGPILRREAEHLGWARRFRALFGAGDCAADKPDPAPMLAALAAVGQGASPAVWYVGDTRLDMEAARRAGVSAVLLGDGAHDGGVPAELCDARFADGHALAAYLRRLDKHG
ncbi:MAG: HAD family hydrolase [Acetobacteraceae bacterium]|nr:HAD family hydrolase [Acetobacteraceae bacterium]MCX7686106.1 HAD family hydrolase [Acetobacteraceae bacterium]MDW8398727.1 HAD family hydrolase [Acetobacteraceae bacterium]